MSLTTLNEKNLTDLMVWGIELLKCMQTIKKNSIHGLHKCTYDTLYKTFEAQ